MEPLLYFAINLTIEIAKTKNADAIDSLLSAIDSCLGESQFELYFDQVSTYLHNQHPEVLEWLLDYLDPQNMSYELDEEESHTSSNTPEEKSEEQSDSFIEKIRQSYLNEQCVFKVYSEDIIHILLDGGFIAYKDYQVVEEKLYISHKAKDYLAAHYDLEYIEPLLGEKDA